MNLDQKLQFEALMKAATDERRSTQHSYRISKSPQGVCDIQVGPPRGQAPEVSGAGQERYDSEGNGRHYATEGVECIEAIQASTSHLSGYEGYLVGQCMKYLWRAGRKDDHKLDLIKCKWYLDRLISLVEEGGCGR